MKTRVVTEDVLKDFQATWCAKLQALRTRTGPMRPWTDVVRDEAVIMARLHLLNELKLEFEWADVEPQTLDVRCNVSDVE